MDNKLHARHLPGTTHRFSERSLDLCHGDIVKDNISEPSLDHDLLEILAAVLNIGPSFLFRPSPCHLCFFLTHPVRDPNVLRQVILMISNHFVTRTQILETFVTDLEDAFVIVKV